VFDLEHEQKRREQLEKLFNRSKEQVEEELYLMEELKKIEIRKKERERKQQDVNKLLTAAVDLDKAPHISSSNLNTSVIPPKLLNQVATLTNPKSLGASGSAKTSHGGQSNKRNKQRNNRNGSNQERRRTASSTTGRLNTSSGNTSINESGEYSPSNLDLRSRKSLIFKVTKL
jgi:hypothetical protein